MILSWTSLQPSSYLLGSFLTTRLVFFRVILSLSADTVVEITESLGYYAEHPNFANVYLSHSFLTDDIFQSSM